MGHWAGALGSDGEVVLGVLCGTGQEAELELAWGVSWGTGRPELELVEVEASFVWSTGQPEAGAMLEVD